MENHDRLRCKPEYETELLNDLEWLGLSPDEGLSSGLHVVSSYRQSDCHERYAAALNKLESQDGVYSCGCSRREIMAVAAHVEGAEPRYPGTCRRARIPLDDGARRAILPPDVVHFDDLRLGPQQQHPAEQCGDVLVRDRRGHWTYQFAVVVDDLAHDVDVIIRGEDLLPSTGRQLLLRRLLLEGSEPKAAPLFVHHPLVLHPDGTKLSKAARDTGIRELRRSGARAGALLADAMRSLGFRNVGPHLLAGDLGELFASHRSWLSSDGAAPE